MTAEELRLDERGLVPAVVQSADDGAVLMLGWMNAEAVACTVDTGEVHFYSRSRQRLWRKGESSGHVLSLVRMTADCDGDAVLVVARPTGPTCHTGARSCFHRPLHGGDGAVGSGLGPLLSVLRERRRERPDGSYTVELLDDGDRALRKLVEEAVEVMLAVKNGDRENLVWEVADLLYHLAVVMVAHDIGAEEIGEELAGRAR